MTKTSGVGRTAGLVLSIAAALGTTSGIASAASGLANLPAIVPVMSCADVVNLDLTGVTDAPVTIQSATIATAKLVCTPSSLPFGE
jgi:hypothetical protein